ncbi:NAD(P)-dependent oxidoreductase [Phytomonospora endophytica]|uniref:3-hydroxyisobutyrate dehydrogenase-like beta-hydroxyacid dehydrogenase n=1 Tax=Phytomonospora endophytica TaxID=714109 RepID=A0A841FG84_9ACTN|nr:NAD(P)-binding domain-containing protein [Phytomonospora endophytica]MBB6035266.1 3-hydroxyisobutyrate dehydrogenase-like beta-hydroxyacid dehydrogenase [Phytomonospora endophytica]
MTDTKTSVTVLGTGRMGSAIARLYLAAGHTVTVWNRTPGKAAELVEAGAVEVGTVADAVAANAFTVVVLFNGDAVRATIEQAGSLGTVLNLSTGRPDEARDIAALVEGRGGRYLDGGMFGVPQTIGSKDSLTIYSGSPDAHEEHRGLLELLGGTLYLGADHGLGSLNDMAVLGGMYGLFAGFFQSVAMVATEGGTATEFTERLLLPWLRETVELLPTLAAEIDAGDYPVSFSDLDVNRTGLANIVRTSREQGADTRLLDPLTELFDAQAAKGFGAASFTRVVEELRAR